MSRLRATCEGKIREKVLRKSRGNRFWFELTRVRVIESQLYVYKEQNQNNSANGTKKCVRTGP